MPGRLTAPPEPESVSTAEEFVAALGRLRQWSGLTYRQLSAAAEAAGDVLPPSTMAGALGRTTLPKEEFVAAFARACGLDDAEAALWVAARKRLAAGPAPQAAQPLDGPAPARSPGGPASGASGGPSPAGPSAPDSAPDSGPESVRDSGPESVREPVSGSVPAGPEPIGRTASGPPAYEPPADGRLVNDPPPRTWRTRGWIVAGAAVVLVLLLGLALMAVRGPSAGTKPPERPSPGRTPQGSATLRSGWYQLTPSHVADRELCVGEGRERNGRTDRPLAVQRPCKGLVPDTYVSSVGSGVYEIRWIHPKEGVGCLTIDAADTRPGTLIAPDHCDEAANQRFALTPAGQGFVMRPLHSGLCVGALYGETDVPVGAEMAQEGCTGRADQVFLFRAVPTPAWFAHLKGGPAASFTPAP
ncbi:helix-turn-helix domain-containing protein [Microbispora sp. NPDC049125]|uniref:helix-turn-helix domain-containing protein n=1 Tax=Microbispora sp. NPDC049125 TaxID=3154929 RepID=UPI0034659B86